jgi:ABC-type glutathione transport system ATPase component
MMPGGLGYEYAKAALPQPLLQAIDLKKHYPVKKGMFAPERLVKALDGVSFTLERGNAGGGRRVGLWEIHPWPSADDD